MHSFMSFREEATTTVKIYANPYDSCFVAENEEFIRQLLTALIPLHTAEFKDAREHRNDKLGSGGKLYLVEGTLVVSMSHFRRVDWLVLAQVVCTLHYITLRSSSLFPLFLSPSLIILSLSVCARVRVVAFVL
jgi:hypothetical protein